MDQPLQPTPSEERDKQKVIPIELEKIAVNLTADGNAVLLQLLFKPGMDGQPGSIDLPMDHDTSAMIGGQMLACSGAIKAKMVIQSSRIILPDADPKLAELARNGH